MFAKLSTALALFAVAAQVAVATPPACLIAAVNTQPNPADINAVCAAEDVSKYISSKCGSNTDAATKALRDICGDAGVTVSNSTSSSSSAASSTGTASLHRTTSIPTGSVSLLSTGIASASSGFLTLSTNGTYTAPSTATASGAITTASATSGAGGSSGSSSGTASGSRSSTSASATPSVPASNAASRLGMDVVGMIVLGVFGAMLLQ